MLERPFRRLPAVLALAVLPFLHLALVPRIDWERAHAGPWVSGAQAVPAAPSQSARQRIDADRLMNDLETLAGPGMEGRLTGTDGSHRAQAYISRRFSAIGLQPVNGQTRQRFSFGTTGRSQRKFPDAVNLMGLIRGRAAPDEYVMVTAHYDHLGVRGEQTYVGADDNASGVAAMLAIAEWFARHPPRTSILFVAFDGEEEGLQGAKHFVAAPPIDLSRVLLVANLDMVGRGDRNQIFVAGPNHYPALKQPVMEAAEGRPITVTIGHDQPAVRGMEDWTQSSDHGPFHAAHVPFLYFGVEDHPDYHKPTDTADKIPRAFYVEATDLILETIIRFANRGTP